MCVYIYIYMYIYIYIYIHTHTRLYTYICIAPGAENLDPSALSLPPCRRGISAGGGWDSPIALQLLSCASGNIPSLREMGGAPRNLAPGNHFLVWIVKPSGCHCTDAFDLVK